MALKLSDLVIMSDVDGTLLHLGKPIHPRNVQALERFVSKGGRFAISTGRSREFTRPLVEQLPVNFPCVIFNGGAIYDYSTEEYLMEIRLPEQGSQYIREIMERFPQCGVLAVDSDVYYDINGAVATLYREVYRNDYAVKGTMSDLKGSLMKSLIFIRPEWKEEFTAFVAEQKFPGVRFVPTNPRLIEMLPEESSKGNALKQLMEMKNIDRSCLVAIGDYYNDKEMIELAGIGVTMHTAPEDLKALAELLVCDCEEGALGDLVEQLEARYQ